MPRPGGVDRGQHLAHGRTVGRTAVDHDRALGAEDAGQPVAAGHHDEPPSACDGSSRPRAGHSAALVGEAGDRDPVRPPGPYAGLDRCPDVVDVHVHVPGRHDPIALVPTTTSESPSPPRSSQLGDRLRPRRRAGTAPHSRTRRSRSRGRRSAASGSRATAAGEVGAGACPVTTSTSASSSTTSPRPPASTTPARASTGSCSGRTGERDRGTAWPPPGPRWPGRRCRRPWPERGRGGHAQHGALDRVGDRGVSRLGRRGERLGHRATAGRRGQASASAVSAQQLRDDHAGVAPRAEQRAPGHAVQHPTQPGDLAVPACWPAEAVGSAPSGSAPSSGASLSAEVERVGRAEVGTGVAVRARVDVELVDLGLVSAQRVQTGLAPAADRGGVQAVQHGSSR